MRSLINILHFLNIVILSTHETSITAFIEALNLKMEWFLSGVKCAINCEHEKLAAMKYFFCNEIISWCWNDAHVLIFCVAVNNFRIILRDSIKGLLLRIETPDHPVKISPFCQLSLNTFSYVCLNSHRLTHG